METVGNQYRHMENVQWYQLRVSPASICMGRSRPVEKTAQKMLETNVLHANSPTVDYMRVFS